MARKLFPTRSLSSHEPAFQFPPAYRGQNSELLTIYLYEEPQQVQIPPPLQAAPVQTPAQVQIPSVEVPVPVSPDPGAPEPPFLTRRQRKRRAQKLRKEEREEADWGSGLQAGSTPQAAVASNTVDESVYRAYQARLAVFGESNQASSKTGDGGPVGFGRASRVRDNRTVDQSGGSPSSVGDWDIGQAAWSPQQATRNWGGHQPSWGGGWGGEPADWDIDPGPQASIDNDWEAALPPNQQRPRERSGWDEPPTLRPARAQRNPFATTTNLREAERGRVQHRWVADLPELVTGARHRRMGRANGPYPTDTSNAPRSSTSSPESIYPPGSFIPHHSHRRERSSFRYAPPDPHYIRSANSPSPDLQPIASPLALAAEEVSVFLQLFQKTKPETDEDIRGEHREMIDKALAGLFKIHKSLRIMEARRNEELGLRTERSATEGGGRCVVCYGEANTVLVPCMHLALCGGCADRMRVKDRADVGLRTVKCPTCRVIIDDRVCLSLPCCVWALVGAAR